MTVNATAQMAEWLDRSRRWTVRGIALAAAAGWIGRLRGAGNDGTPS